MENYDRALNDGKMVRGVEVKTTLDGYLVYEVRTACGHVVIHAAVNRLWAETHGAQQRMEARLEADCPPNACVDCPFSHAALRLVG